MIQKPLKFRRQAGDTIVEVLIAIGIVSAILVGAFAVSAKSTNSVQDTAEHTAGQQYLQAQVEALRSYLLDGEKLPDEVLNAYFCFAPDGDGYDLKSGSDGSDPQAGGLLDCAKQDGGATFQPYIQSTSPNTYKFTMKWPSVVGGTASQSYIYRVYPTT